LTTVSTAVEGGTEGAARAFRDGLFTHGLLVATGSDGVYGYSRNYQRIVEGLDRLVSRLGGGLFEALQFPPLLVRSTFDRTGYLQSFPDLMGTVLVFRGGDREHRELCRRYEEQENWSELLEPAEVVLSSAACHALYPLCSGRLARGGRYFEIANWCFRHEPSTDPARMMAFRMHELVYVGEPAAAQSFRGMMLAAGLQLLGDLGLPMTTVPANDPFFGRVGTILASAQLEDNLKLEGVTPICSEEHPTAIISGNCAREHFGETFGIETADGQVAHSACVAFGIDRITLALLRRHGFDTARWPMEVQFQLWA
jgi:seryl-tRNA synthetase